MLDFKLSLGSAAVRQRRGSLPPPPSAPVTAIGTNGWSATYPSPPSFVPDSAPEKLTLSRQGFDPAGNAVTVSEALTVTSRIRLPFPNQGQMTPDQVALSDYVYSSDAIANVANGSVEASPKPIANWIMPHRLTVGNIVRLELIAAHRNARAGRQVACVKFIASDGANSISQAVSTTVVSGRSGDRNAVTCFQCDLDISALNAGLITVNAEVYPWIGGPASVAKSATDGNEARGFSPRYFLKNTSLAAAPYYAYIKAGGTSGGVFSTNPATAEAAPFDSFVSMWGALNSSAAGKADGVIVRISGNFALGSAASARIQNVGCITFTRDPNLPRASAVLQLSSTGFRPRLMTGLTAPLTTGCIRFKDITVQRTSTATFQGEITSQLEMIFEDVDFDNGSNNAAWLNQSHDYHYGTTFANVMSSSALGAGVYEHRMLRGISADMNASSLEGWWIVGSTIAKPGAFQRGARSFSGGGICFNILKQMSGAIGIGTDQDVSGYVYAQNVFEFTSAASNAALGVSNDGATGSNAHVIVHNNSFAGFFSNGRANLFHEDGATARTSKLHSVKGNIFVQLNTKGDVFAGDGSRVGNWGFLYGVGCEGTFTQYIDSNSGGIGSSFAQAYPGLRSRMGTSATARQDPLFTNHQGTTNSGSTAIAGAGGGTYTLMPGSPAKAMLTSALLSHDLAGGQRLQTGDSAGAYA